MKSYLQNRLTGDISSVYNAMRAFNFSIVLLALFLTCSYITLNAQPVIALEEIARIQAEPVSDQELSTARQAVISVLNERYSNAAKKVRRNSFLMHL